MTHAGPASAGRRYLAEVSAMVAALIDDEWAPIAAAASRVVETLRSGGLIHVFGTGHSHMLAEELFYRAGGLTAVNPVLVEPLMLHASAERSTVMERTEGYGAEVYEGMGLRAGDTLIVASNSGGNAVCEEVATLSRRDGATVIAILSRQHASAAAEERPGDRLAAIADIVIDNQGVVGDAVTDVEGLKLRVGPTSTVVGAAIVNAIAVEVVERLTRAGTPPDVWSSSNVSGGDDHNAKLLDSYRGRVKAL